MPMSKQSRERQSAGIMGKPRQVDRGGLNPRGLVRNPGVGPVLLHDQPGKGKQPTLMELRELKLPFVMLRCLI